MGSSQHSPSSDLLVALRGPTCKRRKRGKRYKREDQGTRNMDRRGRSMKKKENGALNDFLARGAKI